MRKLLLILLLGLGLQGKACDVCGCAAGGSYFGILPGFQQNMLGLRYQYRSFFSSDLPSLSGEWVPDYSHSLERYHSAEAWGRFFLSPRFQLFTFVPLHMNVRDESGDITRITGLGDARLMLAWTAFNNADSVTASEWKHSLLLSGGIKAPTGHYGHRENDGSLNPNLQTGTGSWDALASFYYNLRRKGGGLSMEASWKQNGSNADGYRYGHRFSANLRAFHWFQGQGASLLTYAGLIGEAASKDKSSGITQYYSGGQSLYGQAGLEAYIGRINPGASFNYPLAWELSERMVKPGPQFRINLAYIF